MSWYCDNDCGRQFEHDSAEPRTCEVCLAEQRAQQLREALDEAISDLREIRGVLPTHLDGEDLRGVFLPSAVRRCVEARHLAMERSRDAWRESAQTIGDLMLVAMREKDEARAEAADWYGFAMDAVRGIVRDCVPTPAPWLVDAWDASANEEE